MATPLPMTPSASVTVSVGATQSNVTIGGTGRLLRFANAGPSSVWVGFYEPGQTPPTVTTAAAMELLAGAIEVFSVASDATMVALLSISGGATMNITRGSGGG